MKLIGHRVSARHGNRIIAVTGDWKKDFVLTAATADTLTFTNGRGRKITYPSTATITDHGKAPAHV